MAEDRVFYHPGMGNTLFYREEREEEFDSTWEDDEDEEETAEFNTRRKSRNSFAARDMQNFRHMCRENHQETEEEDDEMGEEENLPNLSFYKNEIKSRPDGVNIKDFHKKWFQDYDRLEWVHSYIQWLFPIQEPGMNYQANVLTKKEIELFRKNENLKKRLLKSYKLMLDFYGIKLLDEEKGKVGRAENWEERFKNLNRNSHNNLRITRILKCLGILGFQHYQAPLVHFFLQETLVEGTLPRVKQSVLDYFMFTVLDKSERKNLIEFAFRHFEPKAEFVWCPQRIWKRFLREMKITLKNTETDPSERDRNIETHQELESPVPDLPEGETTHDKKVLNQGNKLETHNIPAGHENRSDSDTGKEESPHQLCNDDTGNAHEDSGIIIQKNGSEEPNSNMSETFRLPHQDQGCAPDSGEFNTSGEDAEHSRQVCSSNDVQILGLEKERAGLGENGASDLKEQGNELLGHHMATEEALGDADKKKGNDLSMGSSKPTVNNNENDPDDGVTPEKHNEDQITAVPKSDAEQTEGATEGGLVAACEETEENQLQETEV